MSATVHIKESGLVLIKGLNLDPKAAHFITYLRKVRGTDSVWWTGWRWLPLLKKSLRWQKVPIAEGEEHLRTLISQAKQTMVLKTAPINGEEPNNLWPWQRQASALMVHADKFYLGSDVGLGKTRSVLSALLVLRKAEVIQSALIVTTSSTKHQWREELEALLPGQGDGIVVVDGNQEARKEAWEREAFLYVVNYESLRADLQEKKRILWRSFDALVLDEAWKVKNRKAAISESLARFARDIPRRYALNATPVTNHYEDLFGVYRILDPLLFISWTNFAERYCVYQKIPIRGKKNRWGGQLKYPKLVAYQRQEEFQRMIATTFLRRTGEDVGSDRPEVLCSWYWVDLTPEQQRLYAAIRADKTSNPLERTVRARMTCLLHNPPEENPKTLELLELLEGPLCGRKLVVFSESAQYLETVAPILRRAKVATAYLSGKDSSKERELKCHGFTRGTTQVLLSTAAGEAGLNLQAADVVVNLDLPWSPARLQQRIGRVRPYLGGKERTVTVVNVLARDTIEERIVRVIRQKLGDISNLFHGKLDPAIEAVFSQDSLEGQI